MAEVWERKERQQTIHVLQLLNDLQGDKDRMLITDKEAKDLLLAFVWYNCLFCPYYKAKRCDTCDDECILYRQAVKDEIRSNNQ